MTGASGFLGSWISRVLSEDGQHEVIAFLRPTSSEFRLSNIKNLTIKKIDEELWPRTIEKLQADVLIIADWIGVENTLKNDLRQKNNLQRIILIASAAVTSKVGTILALGSQAEVGIVHTVITENTPDNPRTLYGEIKVKTRYGIQSVVGNTDSRFVWARIFSTYGPLDYGNWLLPNLVDTLSSRKKMLLTKAEQNWNYLHAYDVARAVRMILMNSPISGIVNIANTETIVLKDLINFVALQLNAEELLVYGAKNYEENQVMNLSSNSKKLNDINWEPVIELNKGILQTIAWLQRKKLPNLYDKYGQIISLKIPTRP